MCLEERCGEVSRWREEEESEDDVSDQDGMLDTLNTTSNAAGQYDRTPSAWHVEHAGITEVQENLETHTAWEPKPTGKESSAQYSKSSVNYHSQTLEDGCIPTNRKRQTRAQPPKPSAPILQEAVTELTKLSKDVTLDVIFRARLNGMLAFLHLYMSDQDRGWHEASLLATTASGKGIGLAHSRRQWTWDYLEDCSQLPHSRYGRH